MDSLIVTNLIDLSRNHAIHDAFIVSGDGDVRIGIQMAQTFGVKVHLIGIGRTRSNQSPDLRHESDSHSELSREDIALFLSVSEDTLLDEDLSEAQANLPINTEEDMLKLMREIVDQVIDSMDQSMMDGIVGAYNGNPRLVPIELDRQALGRIGSRLGRDLDGDEKRLFRGIEREVLSSMQSS